jgi:hypothetical protein
MNNTLQHFHVIKRNLGHWDFVSDEGRLFRLRGIPGQWLAFDEREKPYPSTQFKSFGACAAFIVSELTSESLEQDLESPGNNKPKP